MVTQEVVVCRGSPGRCPLGVPCMGSPGGVSCGGGPWCGCGVDPPEDLERIPWTLSTGVCMMDGVTFRKSPKRLLWRGSPGWVRGGVHLENSLWWSLL